MLCAGKAENQLGCTKQVTAAFTVGRDLDCFSFRLFLPIRKAGDNGIGAGLRAARPGGSARWHY